MRWLSLGLLSDLEQISRIKQHDDNADGPVVSMSELPVGYGGWLSRNCQWSNPGESAVEPSRLFNLTG